MTLNDFREERGWNYRQLAEFLATGHDQKQVRRWCLPFAHAEFQRPRDETRIEIERKTEGKVGMADWYPKPAAPAAAVARGRA